MRPGQLYYYPRTLMGLLGHAARTIARRIGPAALVLIGRCPAESRFDSVDESAASVAHEWARTFAGDNPELVASHPGIIDDVRLMILLAVRDNAPRRAGQRVLAPPDPRAGGGVRHPDKPELFGEIGMMLDAAITECASFEERERQQAENARRGRREAESGDCVIPF